ncbi:ribose-phosphate pyrophosphokinase [Deinococcus peraridilitoris DSM 19664]|uniref:ribose-phosphate diphosphokinase n=2 Tax=Deinococcus TaxID=1298 RepID=L0A5Q6_DEIPD|nr:ribose-phosphate pyrophosphokinase [Deinococcus peraridilitoris DSM 19664]
MLSNSSPLMVFSGQSNCALAQEICNVLGTTLGQSETQKFTNDNLVVRYKQSLREADVFIVQSFSSPVSDSIMELLLMIDAAKSASAARVTAVIPYYSYARSDKKDEPRISIAGRLVADLIQAAGADRVLTMTLHSPQVHGFFKIPVDHLSAEVVIAEHLQQTVDGFSDGVVLAPDAGDIKRASALARRLDSGLAFIDKRRTSDTTVNARALIGDVQGRKVFIVDDEISTAGSLVEAVNLAKANGADSVHVAVTHGVYTGPAVERIHGLDVVEVCSTNTVDVPYSKIERSGGKLKTLSVAPLFAKAIQHIHTGESVSALFE